MELAAVGTRDLGNAVFFLLRRFHRVKLQLLAVPAAVDVYLQRSRKKLVPILPQLQLFLPDMNHFPAAAQAAFPFHYASLRFSARKTTVPQFWYRTRTRNPARSISST